MTNPYESPTHCEAGEASISLEFLCWVAVVLLIGIEIVSASVAVALIGTSLELSASLLLASIASAGIAISILKWML